MYKKLKKAKLKYKLTLYELVFFTLAVLSNNKRYFRLASYFYKKTYKQKPSIELLFQIGMFYFHYQKFDLADYYFDKIDDYDNLSNDEISYIVIAAAYNNNISHLEKISVFNEVPNSIKNYTNGFIAYAKGENDYGLYYSQAVKAYKNENNIKFISMASKLPNYIKYSINVIDIELDTTKEYKNYYKKIDETDFSKLDGTFLLISLELNYLKIFSDFTVSKIRKKHDNQIHFNVVAQNEEEINRIKLMCDVLNQKYSNISYSILLTTYNSALVSALSRFKEMSRLMKKYSLTGIILDADSNFDSVDLIKLENSIDKIYSCSLFTYTEPVIWAKYPANACIFRNTLQSENLLNYCDKYYAYFIEQNKAFWTIDQTALFFAFREYPEISFLNLNSLDDPRKMHYKIPRKIEKLKIKVKSQKL